MRAAKTKTEIRQEQITAAALDLMARQAAQAAGAHHEDVHEAAPAQAPHHEPAPPHKH